MCENDNSALLYVLNSMWKPIDTYYYEDVDSDENMDCGYKCKGCKKFYIKADKIKKYIFDECINELMKKDINKLMKKKDINELMKNKDITENIITLYVNIFKDNVMKNNIIAAFGTIKNLLDDKFNETDDDLEKFARYFLDNVLLNRHKYYDITVASQMFDQLNSREKKLEISDIIRNSLIRNISSQNQKKYYDKLDVLISNVKNIGFSKEYINVFKLLCELVNDKLECSKQSTKELFENVLVRDDQNVEERFKLIEKEYDFINKIKEQLQKCAFGLSILQDINWEVIKFLIVPFCRAHKTDKIIFHISRIISCKNNFCC